MTQTIDFKALFDKSPYPYLLLAPDLTIIGANGTYLRTAERSLEDIVGQHVFDAFPQNPDDPDDSSLRDLQASLERAINTGKPDSMALVRYAIPRDTPEGMIFDERYWSIIHTPALDDKGKVAFLFQNPIDVTELYAAKKALRAAEVERDFHFRTEGSIFTRSQELEATNRMLDAERTHLRRLFDQAPGFIAVLRGPQYVFELVNEAYYQLVGHRELVGKPMREALPELGGQGYFRLLDRVVASGEAFVGREMKVLMQRLPDGPMSEIYLDFLFQPVIAPDGSVSGVFIQGHEVTEQKRARDELYVSNERWKLAIEGAGDGVWDWNLQDNEAVYSTRWKEIVGFAEHEFPNRFEQWETHVHPDDLPGVLAVLRACLEGTVPTYNSEYRLRCKNGDWKWVLSRGIVVARDADGKPLRMTGMTSDISEKKQSDELIWHHANFDSLTALPNRRLFRDRLDQEVKRAHRSGLQIGLLFIDLDRFKEANDLLGHDVGDLLLKQAALRLSACVRESDTVARLGGDEFTIILTELDNPAYVEQLAQKALDTLAEPFRLGNEVVYLSASIGITLYPADAGGPEELIRNADQAMYAAKKAGRNQFSYFTRSMQEKAHIRLRLGGDLRNALGAGQLEVHYQPIVDLSTGQIAKAEALLRWHHPKLGLVDPAQFIPLAEESGLINEIGDWVFKQAASCSQRWSAQSNAPLQIGVNKSPLQFISHSREMNWADYLKQLGLSGSSISVEITEGLLLNASADVAEQLLQYRDAGIQVTIDDFGTGYSSMAYLKKFDIDYLKIDQSFVRDMEADAGNRTIAESIIVMAHKLGMQVIAEGIETIAQKELLIAAGCDYGQGFLFSAAVPPQAFEQMLAESALVANASGRPPSVPVVRDHKLA
ncbi:MAG TPA: EAL domain-containing protein [Burkholderiaceae bacterium]|nr:EAL domain-containing protein [Burkholderiaceae bacterium]